MGCCTSNPPKQKKIPNRKSLDLAPSRLVTWKKFSLDEQYQLFNKIGQGAVGGVQLARHKVSGLNRAIKTIPLNSEVYKSDILSEVDVMKELDHPNIVKICQVYQETQCIHLVLQLCQGGQLFDRIAQLSSFTQKQAAKVFLEFASAVNYLHSKKLVHRDLKPENLLFENRQLNSRVKLADFGTAVSLPSDGYLTQRVGSLYYVAPEVLKGKYTQKCDVWSSGVILFMMLAGFPPFNDHLQTEVYKKILKNQVQFNSRVWNNISSSAKNLIKSMLNKDPQNRPSMEEVLQNSWVRKRTSEKSTDREVATKSLKMLKNFNVQEKLERATLQFIANQLLTQEERSKLENLFEELDKNHDGKLSKAELKKGFRKFGVQIDDFDEFLDKCDSDGSGYVDYTEFLTACIDWETSLSRNRLYEAFRAYDIDGSGTISLEQLRTIFSVNERNRHYFIDFILKADVNGDGEIDFEEFANFMLTRVITNRI